MLEEVSFLSAMGVSLPLQDSRPWYARKRFCIALKNAMRPVSNEQMDEKREGIALEAASRAMYQGLKCRHRRTLQRVRVR